MKTITMTEFNQGVSAVTREVIETGATIRVTNRGRVVLRIIPETSDSSDPLTALISSGRATAPRTSHRPPAPRSPVGLSRPLDELLDEDRDDIRL